MGDEDGLTEAERRLLPHRRTAFPDERVQMWTRVRCRMEAARRARGLTQDAMAEATGLGLATIRRQEAKSTSNPSIRVLVAYAHVLEVPLTALIDAEDCEWPGPGQQPPAWRELSTETQPVPMLPPE